MKFIAGPANSTATRFQVLWFVHRVRFVLGPQIRPPSYRRYRKNAQRDRLDAVLGGTQLCWAGWSTTASGRSRRSDAPSCRVARQPHVAAHSCRATDTRMASANSAIPIPNIIGRGKTSCAATSSVAGALPGPSLGVEYVFHGSRFGDPPTRAAQDVSDCFHDRREPDGEPGRRRRLLVGGVVPQVMHPPDSRPGGRGPPRERQRSTGSNSQVEAMPKSQARRRSGNRAGQPSASEIGSFIGRLAWAMVEPSVKVTIECTIDCGCTTTSIRSEHRTAGASRSVPAPC